MTAALGNTAQGTPFATGVDAFVYPQMIGYALRAPTTQDIYNPGTRWQNNAVQPAVQYYTIGSGIWYELPNTSFGVSSVAGTTNQITASPTVGSVVLSIPSVFVAPGSIASTTTVTGGTGVIATTGNVTSTAGNLVATIGNLNLNGPTSKINISAATPASASIGTSAVLSTGTVTVATTAVTAASKIFLTRAVAGGTLGNLSVGTITAGTSFTITSDGATDTSTVNWLIIN